MYDEYGDNGYSYNSYYHKPEECECPARCKHFAKDKNLHSFWCPMWRDPITGAKNEQQKEKK